jgi:hypothetical protein
MASQIHEDILNVAFRGHVIGNAEHSVIKWKPVSFEKAGIRRVRRNSA